MLESDRHLRWGCMLLIAVVVLSSAGYVVLLRWPVGDAIYMTAITITTIGFAEVRQLDGAGRAWTLVVILFGLVAIAYLGSGVISAMTEGRLRQAVGRYKLDQKLQRLSDHVVVCGYGHMASLVCHGLEQRHTPFVAIDVDPDRVTQAEEAGHMCIRANATDEQALREAGVERARALVTVLPSDADNVFITLSARSLNRQLTIVARAEQPATPQKLHMAGATRVVSPHALGAMRITNLVTRPTVADLVETITSTISQDLSLEELLVPATSSLVGCALGDSDIRRRTGLIVVAIKRTDGTQVFNPGSSQVFEANDTVVVLGPTSKIDAFRHLYAVTSVPMGPGPQAGGPDTRPT